MTAKYKQLYVADFNFFIKYWADTKSIYVTYRNYNDQWHNHHQSTNNLVQEKEQYHHILNRVLCEHLPDSISRACSTSNLAEFYHSYFSLVLLHFSITKQYVIYFYMILNFI